MRHSNLLREAYATYSGKEWENIFGKELTYIKSETVKTIVIASLEFFADEMNKTGPASSTGKYHPLSDDGDGGLIRHTKTVVRYVVDLINKHEHKGFGTKAKNAREDFGKDENGLSFDSSYDTLYDPIFDFRDEMIAAAILHDMAKYDNGEVEQAEIDSKWNENPEKYFRKPILVSYTQRLYRIPVGGFESYTDEDGNPSFIKSRGWWKCDYKHPPVGGWDSVVDENNEPCTKCEKPVVYTKTDHPKRMADYVRQLGNLLPLQNAIDSVYIIADLIECHEGKWNGFQGKHWMNPRDLATEILTKCANLVSEADYVASRAQGDYTFDRNGDLAVDKAEVLKAKKQSFIDDNKEEIEELKAEIEDLQILVDTGEATEREKKSLERNKKLLKKLTESKYNRKPGELCEGDLFTTYRTFPHRNFTSINLKGVNGEVVKQIKGRNVLGEFLTEDRYGNTFQLKQLSSKRYMLVESDETKILGILLENYSRRPTHFNPRAVPKYNLQEKSLFGSMASQNKDLLKKIEKGLDGGLDEAEKTLQDELKKNTEVSKTVLASLKEVLGESNLDIEDPESLLELLQGIDTTALAKVSQMQNQLAATLFIGTYKQSLSIAHDILTGKDSIEVPEYDKEGKATGNTKTVSGEKYLVYCEAVDDNTGLLGRDRTGSGITSKNFKLKKKKESVSLQEKLSKEEIKQLLTDEKLVSNFNDCLTVLSNAFVTLSNLASVVDQNPELQKILQKYHVKTDFNFVTGALTTVGGILKLAGTLTSKVNGLAGDILKGVGQAMISGVMLARSGYSLKKIWEGKGPIWKKVVASAGPMVSVYWATSGAASIFNIDLNSVIKSSIASTLSSAVNLVDKVSNTETSSGDVSSNETSETTPETSSKETGSTEDSETNDSEESNSEEESEEVEEKPFTPGSNPKQLTDKEPTIENSNKAVAKAKEGDVIERADGSRYTLTQGDINYAKKLVANSEENEVETPEPKSKEMETPEGKGSGKTADSNKTFEDLMAKYNKIKGDVEKANEDGKKRFGIKPDENETPSEERKTLTPKEYEKEYNARAKETGDESEALKSMEKDYKLKGEEENTDSKNSQDSGGEDSKEGPEEKPSESDNTAPVIDVPSAEPKKYSIIVEINGKDYKFGYNDEEDLKRAVKAEVGVLQSQSLKKWQDEGYKGNWGFKAKVNYLGKIEGAEKPEDSNSGEEDSGTKEKPDEGKSNPTEEKSGFLKRLGKRMKNSFSREDREA